MPEETTFREAAQVKKYLLAQRYLRLHLHGDGKNAVTMQSRLAVTGLLPDNKPVMFCFVTDDSNLQDVFICVALISRLFFYAFGHVW